MIYFITYGDQNYLSSKQRIVKEAINCGYLDHVQAYGREDLPEDFIKKTEPYINHSRGGGYWMWKAPILLKTFEKMNDGDYCVYVDCGCTVNPQGKERLHEFLKMIDNTESGIFRYEHVGTEEHWHTNSKVFEFFGKLDDMDFRKRDILMAGVLIFKKNKNSQRYLERLLEITQTAPYLFSDEYNDYKKYEKNQVHRHDQSVSSCLVKLEVKDPVIVSDETYSPDYDGWMHLFNVVKVPFLATRIRG